VEVGLGCGRWGRGNWDSLLAAKEKRKDLKKKKKGLKSRSDPPAA